MFQRGYTEGGPARRRSPLPLYRRQWAWAQRMEPQRQLLIRTLPIEQKYEVIL